METKSKKSHKNVEKVDNLNYSEECETIKIDETPFRVQRVHNQWFTAIGDKRTSDFYTNSAEAIIDAQTITFDKIIQLIGIIADNTNKI